METNNQSHNFEHIPFPSAQMNTITNYLVLIYSPIFLIIGIPGNLVSMVIWLRRTCNSPGSTCLFLAVMCATDTYVLIHGCLRNSVRAAANQFFNGSSFDLRVQLGCSAPLFFFTFLSDLSVWIIILLSVERALSVLTPVSVRVLCQLSRGGLALFIVALFLAICNCHFFWMVQIHPSQEPGNEGFCEFKSSDNFFSAHWSKIDFALYSFIPLALILALNLTILIRLKRTQSRSSCLATGAGNRSARILRTVICMSITHFLFTMPIVIYFLSERAMGCDNHRAICNLVQGVCIMLQLMNHLTHFFIYSITSSLFMRDLVTLYPSVQVFIRSPSFKQALRRRTRIAEEFGIRIPNQPLLDDQRKLSNEPHITTNL